jgi:hypothetical protein
MSKRNELRDAKIIALHDSGMSVEAIAAEVGIVGRYAAQIIEHETIRREAVAAIDASQLSLSQQKRNEAWRKQETARLRAEILMAERAAVRRWWIETLLPDYRRKLAEAEQVIKARRGVMSAETFRAIAAALHPDSRLSISDERLAVAFQKFTDLKLALVKESEMPSSAVPDIPSTPEELDAARAAATAMRRARRGARSPMSRA